MRGVYTWTIEISALSTARCLILLGTNSRTCFEILSASVKNKSSETNEQLDCAITRLSSPDTDIADATLITATKSEEGDASATCTVRGNVTQEPGTWDSTNIDQSGDPSLSGYSYDPLPEERVIISPSEYVGLRILTAPSAFDAICKIRGREIGG